MKKRCISLLFATTLIICALTVNAYENIALGKNFTYSIAPDGGGETLTDELFGIWDETVLSQDAVTYWNHLIVKDEPLLMTLDLGAIEPLDSLIFSIFAENRYGEYQWPRSIQVYVSNDNVSYYLLGDLISSNIDRLVSVDSLAPSTAPPFYRRWFYLSNLQTKGRYIRFAIKTGGPDKFICDEVKVYEGPTAYLQNQHSGVPAQNFNVSETDLVEIACKVRFFWDIQNIATQIENSSITASEKTLLNTQLDLLLDELDEWEFTGDVSQFKAIIPYNELHTDIWRVYGDFMSRLGYNSLTIWTNPRYEFLKLGAHPRTFTDVELKMMGNEYRGRTINFTNSTTQSKVVNFQLIFPPSSSITSPEWLKVFKVEFVDTFYKIPEAQPLVEFTPNSNGVYTMTVPPGMTRQIWLSFDSHHVSGGAVISGSLLAGVTNFPIELTVSPITMSNEVSLNTGVFEYLDINNFPDETSVVNDLKAHNINIASVRVTPGLIALPDNNAFDANGNLSEELDFSEFEALMLRRPGYKHYLFATLITTLFGNGSEFCGFSIYSPEGANAISQWGAKWDAYLAQKNIPEGKIIFHLFDEPQQAELPLLAQWYELFDSSINSIDLSVTTYLPLTGLEDIDSDIFIPSLVFLLQNISQPSGQAMVGIPASGKKLFFYSCLNVWNFDPAAYYRFQAWQCYNYKATGNLFWGFGDVRGSSSWNKYISRHQQYSIVYRDSNSITPTKNWEALREGTQDYEYLKMLEKRIEELPLWRISDKIHAEECLATAMETAFSARHLSNWYWFYWCDNNFNADKMDEARLMVLDELESLQ